jgi:hypothetical protein
MKPVGDAADCVVEFGRSQVHGYLPQSPLEQGLPEEPANFGTAPGKLPMIIAIKVHRDQLNELIGKVDNGARRGDRHVGSKVKGDKRPRHWCKGKLCMGACRACSCCVCRCKRRSPMIVEPTISRKAELNEDQTYRPIITLQNTIFAHNISVFMKVVSEVSSTMTSSVG